MVVISYTTIRNYTTENDSNQTVVDGLNGWYLKMVKGDFANLSELKAVFNTVDYVGNDRYVFNVLGNNYRLIALIHFDKRTAYVLFIGTHKEYDKIDAKNVLFKKA